MARTNLPITNAVANSGVVNPTATAIDQANGMNVALASSAIPSASQMDMLILVVDNTAVGAHVVTVRAGTSNPPAFRGGIGDMTVSVGASQIGYIGPFEPARFEQSDGSLNIDFDAGTTGTVLALLVPKHY